MPMIEELLTFERRQKAAEVQALRRERAGHRVLTDPAQIKFRWGVQRELTASQQLQALQTSGRPDAQREELLCNQIAEGKAAQGKFAEAAAIGKRDTLRAEYEAKALALANPESKCECPAKQAQRQPGNAKALETDTQIVAEILWTGDETVTLLRCVLCGKYSLLQRQHE